MNVDIVADVGFGDAGKGVIVDNLCNGSYTLVVRFSGGQQCGHCTIRDGVKHIFSNIGSGGLQGCDTFFTKHTTFYPNTYLQECRVLRDKGVNIPKVYLHPLCRITTRYDVAFNRASEEVLSKNGSCGLGVGRTMKRNDESHYNLYAVDLLHRPTLKLKINAIASYYDRLASQQNTELEFDDSYHSHLERLEEDMPDIDSMMSAGNVYVENLTRDTLYRRYGNIVFEGSQGILLDMHHGIFPNVTYANTTCKNAIECLAEWGEFYSINVWYASRCYGTRHGRGWVPNNTDIDLINNEEEINKFNPFQEDFKVFEFDKDLLEHAIQIDSIYHGGLAVRTNMVFTCVDQRPGWEHPKNVKGIDKIWLNSSPKCGNMIEVWDEH